MSVGVLDASMNLVWETCHMHAKHCTTCLQKQFPFVTFTSNKLGRINQLLKRRATPQDQDIGRGWRAGPLEGSPLPSWAAPVHFCLDMQSADV